MFAIKTWQNIVVFLSVIFGRRKDFYINYIRHTLKMIRPSSADQTMHVNSFFQDNQRALILHFIPFTCFVSFKSLRWFLTTEVFGFFVPLRRFRRFGPRTTLYPKWNQSIFAYQSSSKWNPNCKLQAKGIKRKLWINYEIIIGAHRAGKTAFSFQQSKNQ